MQCVPGITLNHWGRVTHICVGKLAIISSYNGLSPGRRQAIIWTNAAILLIGPLGTNFSEILDELQIFPLKKILLKMSSAKCCPFRLRLNVLTAGVLFGFVEGSNLWALGLWPPGPLIRQRGWSRWTWSNWRRGDLGRYGWMRDEIGGGMWSQCTPPSVHGTYSRLTAVLLGACSYAKWFMFWVITIMYITVYICMFYLSFYQSCMPFFIF